MKKKRLKLKKEVKDELMIVLVLFALALVVGFALADRVDEIENNKTNNNKNTSIKLVK